MFFKHALIYIQDNVSLLPPYETFLFKKTDEKSCNREEPFTASFCALTGQ